jgi:hypothetical protein
MLQKENDALKVRIKELELDVPFSQEMERQMNEQVSHSESEKGELEGKVSQLTHENISKDNAVTKLQRKLKMTEENFEWTKGRMLEYYGLHQIGMRDNQHLRETNEQLGEALQGVATERDALKAEREGLAVTEQETDELIARMMEDAKKLEALRSSRRSSVSSRMDWDPSTSSGTMQTPTPAAQPLPLMLDRPSPTNMQSRPNRPNTQATPSRSEPLHTGRSLVTGPMDLEDPTSATGFRAIAPPANHSDAFQMPTIPSWPNPENRMSRRDESAPATPPRHDDSMTFVGIGANTMRRRLSVTSSASSEYVSPYERGNTSSPDPFGPPLQEDVSHTRPSPSDGTFGREYLQQTALVQPSRILQLSLNPGTFRSLPAQQTMGGSSLMMQSPQTARTVGSTPLQQVMGASSLLMQPLPTACISGTLPTQQITGGSSSLSMPPPLTAGTLGPLLAAPVRPQNFSFLVSGSLAMGQRNLLAVHSSVYDVMMNQVAKWDGRMERYHWTTKTSLSHQRCVDTRVVSRLSRARNPPASTNPNIACASCVNKGLLCVLIEDRGPVVVPLPLSDRSPGATPTIGDYYVKSRQRAPVVLPQPSPPLPPPANG